MPTSRSSSRPREPLAGRPRRAGFRRPSEPTVAPQRTSEPDLTAEEATAGAGARPSFSELGLPPQLVAALAERNITAAFPIQARTLADALAGRDVLGRGETGSGKTLAFGLPLLARLSTSGKSRPGAPRALVLVPTRELAQQVHDVLAPLARSLGLYTVAVYGGSPYERQVRALRRGVDVVVATPGRLLDLVERRAASLEEVGVAVVDEADHMADLGFLPAVTEILDQTPAEGQRMLFSATLDRGVDAIVRRYLTDPATHNVAPEAAPVAASDHRFFTVARRDKAAVLAEIAARPGRTLVFVRTKAGADELVVELRRAGVEAGAIHGDLPQGARRRALEAFASGRVRVLVATDVAARGIHVDDVDLVVHFDLPDDHKSYLHRSGRTARAGASGTVVSLVQPEQRRRSSHLQQRAGVRGSTVAVSPGHAAVRELATSGTPIVVAPDPRPAGSWRREERNAAGTGRRRPAHRSSR